MQKESMQAAFEICYETWGKLHEIGLLNLKDDHEAEVEGLRNSGMQLFRRHRH
jgi:hypothetical protein